MLNIAQTDRSLGASFTPMKPAHDTTLAPKGSPGAPSPRYACCCDFDASGWKKVPGNRENLVGVAGFEPATPCSRSRCATRLRYTPSSRGSPYIDVSPKARKKRPDCRAARPSPAVALASGCSARLIIVCAGAGPLLGMHGRAIIDSGMGRGQAVRQRVLVP